AASWGAELAVVGTALAGLRAGGAGAEWAGLDAGHSREQITGQVDVRGEADVELRVARHAVRQARGVLGDPVHDARADDLRVRVGHRQRRAEEAARESRRARPWQSAGGRGAVRVGRARPAGLRAAVAGPGAVSDGPTGFPVPGSTNARRVIGVVDLITAGT